jgi:hypothetical protein
LDEGYIVKRLQTSQNAINMTGSPHREMAARGTARTRMDVIVRPIVAKAIVQNHNKLDPEDTEEALGFEWRAK